MLKFVWIRAHQVGLHFHADRFVGLLEAGTHVLVDPLGRAEVTKSPLRAPWIQHEKLDLIVQSGALAGRALVLDLEDHQRALVWIDNRFSTILGAGLHAAWTAPRSVRAEIVDARSVRFTHPQLATILRTPGIERFLELHMVPPHHAGLLFVDGEHRETLTPGLYATWKQVATVKVQTIDLRETLHDIVGQDLMTADKVTLRLNLVVLSRVVDPLRGVTTVDDLKQAIYREAQLALRASVGERTLDAFLTDKDAVSKDVTERLRARATALGVEIASVGVRDVILPGEMKELLNKVTEAKTAAEADLIARREETAAVRSQLNTAKMLQENPTLMRLRELDLLEKIAATGKLNIILGEKGLTDRVVNLL